MPSPSGGSAPAAGSSGTGTGASANVYTPTQQPGIDQSLSSILYGLYGPAFNSVPYPLTPAASALPAVQSQVGQLTNNPYAAQSQAAANQYASQGRPLEQQTALQGAGVANSSGTLNTNVQYLQDLATNPIYQSISAQEQANPYYQQALTGAQQGASIGGTAANQAAANSTALSGAVPGILGIGQQIAQPIAKTQALGDLTASYAPKLTDLATQVSAPLAGLQQAGQSVWNTAQDPQNALYNRTLNQVQQQQNVANAQAGIAATPYGASVAGDATRNFNIDWQNQQLQRQLAGLAGLGQADTQAAGLGSTAGNLITGAGALNQGAASIYDTAAQIGTRAAATDDLGGQVAQTALGLGQGATNLAAGSAALPNQAFQANLAAQTNAANQELNAGLAGSAGTEQALGTQAGLISQGQGILNTGLQNMLQQGQAPYNTSVNQANTALGGLGNLINVGNNQYAPLQQFVNDAESYLGLGQSASGLSGQLGQLGVNQQNQALQGIGTAAGLGSNLLLGNQGLSGALGLNPQTGLLGGLGGGTAANAATGAGLSDIFASSGTPAVGGALDFAGTGAADAGAAAAGGGFSIADLLPTAALS